MKEIAPSEVPDYHIYESEENEVCFKLAQYEKGSTSDHFFQCLFRTEIEPEFQNYFRIFTDGSKFQEGNVAYCAFFPDLLDKPILSGRLSDNASIFTAEVMAIMKSLEYIQICPRSDRRFIIYCDSKSVLESIYNQKKSSHY